MHAGFGGDDAGNGDDDELFAQPSSSKKQKQDKGKKQGKKGKQGKLALCLRKCAMDDPALDRWLTCTAAWAVALRQLPWVRRPIAEY